MIIIGSPKQLDIAYVNPHVPEPEPVHADFIWAFKGMPKLWLADEFPPAEADINGHYPYFRTNLLTVFANTCLQASSIDSILYIGPHSLEYLLPTVISANYAHLHIVRKDQLPRPDISKYVEKSKLTNELNEPKLSWGPEDKSLQYLDRVSKIILIETTVPGQAYDHKQDITSTWLETAVKRAPSGTTVVHLNLGEPGNKGLLNDISALIPSPPELPIGDISDNIAVFDPNECGWGPGTISRFVKA